MLASFQLIETIWKYLQISPLVPFFTYLRYLNACRFYLKFESNFFNGALRSWAMCNTVHYLLNTYWLNFSIVSQSSKTHFRKLVICFFFHFEHCCGVLFACFFVFKIFKSWCLFLQLVFVSSFTHFVIEYFTKRSNSLPEIWLDVLFNGVQIFVHAWFFPP